MLYINCCRWFISVLTVYSFAISVCPKRTWTMWPNQLNLYKNIDGANLSNNKYNTLLAFSCYTENFEFNILSTDFFKCNMKFMSFLDNFKSLPGKSKISPMRQLYDWFVVHLHQMLYINRDHAHSSMLWVLKYP